MYSSILLAGGLLVVVALTACSNIPFLGSASPTPSSNLTYDVPVMTLTILNGKMLPGTNLAYAGKTDTGAAKMLIGGLVAPKQILDTVDWQGEPTANVKVKLTMRVVTFDENSVTLGGSAHIELTNVKVQPATGVSGTPSAALMEFSAPVTFSLKPNEQIPGSLLFYTGMTADGAQFGGLEGYPYRKQADSLQYIARLAPKVTLRLDLRVINFSETGAVVGGTATIRIDP